MKKLFSLIMIIVMVFGLTGCSGSDKNTTSDNTGSDAGSVSVTSDDSSSTTDVTGKAPYSGTITIACSALDAEALNKVLAEYQKTNPDVQLETIIVQSATDLETMFTTWIASDTLPDMCTGLAGTTLQMYAENGYILPVTDYKDKLVIGDTEMYSYNGDLYGFPMSITASGIIVNKTALDAAGVELSNQNYPKNWSDLMSLLDKCVAAGIEKPLAISGKDAGEITAWTFQYLYQAVYGKNPNWYADVLRSKAAWNDDLCVEMFNKYAQMLPYVPDDALGESMDGMRKRLITGESPIQFQTTGIVGSIKQLDPEVEVIVLPPCFTDDAKDQTLISGFECGVSITKDAKNKELCYDFLDFLTSEQGATIFNESAGYIPSTKKNNAQLDSTYDLIREILANDELPNSPYLSKQWIPGIKEIVKSGMQDWFAGADIKTVTDKIQEEHERLLQNNPDFVKNFLANYKDK